jgi:hypothetical protein
MILVAGLAVAGLAGIAAAFYFSMRPGDSRARARASGPDRGAARRPPASRSGTTQASSDRPNSSARPARPARPARSAGDAGPGNGHTADRTGASTVIDFTGPQRALEDSEPVAPSHRARHGDRRDDAPDASVPSHRATTRRSRAEEPDDAARSRRRVGWRKGSDLDEELWPVEAFGGVSDEQFWDDMASDKPLATTARAAQPESAATRRPPNAAPLPDLYAGDDRSNGRRGAAEGTGTHPQPRLAPDDRTAVQSAVTSPATTQPYPTATQPSSVATRPVRVGQQPAEPRGRTRAAVSADEDPLTSPAYSLRPSGSVDGRAYPSRRSGDLTRDQYEAAVGQVTQIFSLADARAAGGGYPDGVPPFRQFDQPSPGANGRSRPDGYRPDPLRPDPLRSGNGYGGTVPNAAYPYPHQPYTGPAQPVSTPPYGYGNTASSRAQGGQGVPAASGGDPRRAYGGWSAGQTSGNGAGDGGWGSRPAYPPVNGYHGPYDPRGYDRRLAGLP